MALNNLLPSCTGLTWPVPSPSPCLEVTTGPVAPARAMCCRAEPGVKGAPGAGGLTGWTVLLFSSFNSAQLVLWSSRGTGGWVKQRVLHVQLGNVLGIPEGGTGFLHPHPPIRGPEPGRKCSLEGM